MTVNVFAVPVFFVVFRETLETAVIVSVLLAFLKQTLDGPNRDREVYKKLVKQVWLGTGLGLLICLIIGGGLIGAFYGLGKDRWAATEYYWEGSFAVFASLVISILGAALLRVSKMQEKWRVKLAKALETKPVTTGGRKGAFKRWCEKYALFMLPFITVLREGLEAIVFIAGVSFSSPASAVPLPVVIGLIAGFAAGYLLYKGGASSKLQFFLVISTCLLYLVAAGLFSRAVWYFEAQDWNNVIGGDAAETGAGAGSYDIDKSVWHVNFGNPELNGGGGWGIFNAILGWTNSATYGSVISYNVYWIAVITGFLIMRYKETTGHFPLMKAKKSKGDVSNSPSSSILRQHSPTKDPEKNVVEVGAAPARTISE
ncbi:Plasma membrane iron permease [Lachnellula suecica]|uniref:Plasma membrane iron permease n=1 Tax=Lachnellula suecica TaxID=602035 RepID=A0A8T9BXF5_9HELO|nr:Plasma membrane iron permease [Lachnellula suecica]